NGREDALKLLSALEDMPCFTDQCPHALPVAQRGALFDAIFGAFGGPAKGGENRRVPAHVQRIVAPVPRRNHATIQIHDPLEFLTIKPGLPDLLPISRKGCHIGHQARSRSLKRGMSSLPSEPAPRCSLISWARRF